MEGTSIVARVVLFAERGTEAVEHSRVSAVSLGRTRRSTAHRLAYTSGSDDVSVRCGDPRCPGEIEPGFSTLHSLRGSDPRLVGSRPARRSLGGNTERVSGRSPGVGARGLVVENPRFPMRARGGTATGGRKAPRTRRALLAASIGPEPPREWWFRKRRDGVHPRHGNGLRFFPRGGPDESRTKNARSGAEPRACCEESESAGSDLVTVRVAPSSASSSDRRQAPRTCVGPPSA